jgi:hypothetical protein
MLYQKNVIVWRSTLLMKNDTRVKA